MSLGDKLDAVLLGSPVTPPGKGKYREPAAGEDEGEHDNSIKFLEGIVHGLRASKTDKQKIRKLEAEAAKLETVIVEKNATINELRAENEGLRREIEEKDATIAQVHATIVEKNAIIDQLRAENAGLRQKVEEKDATIADQARIINELRGRPTSVTPLPDHIPVPRCSLSALRRRLDSVSILRATNATVATARDFDEADPNAPLVGPKGLVKVLKEIRLKLHAAERVFDKEYDLPITYHGGSRYYVPAHVGDACMEEKRDALRAIDALLAI